LRIWIIYIYQKDIYNQTADSGRGCGKQNAEKIHAGKKEAACRPLKKESSGTGRTPAEPDIFPHARFIPDITEAI
jgi:hypothetical protein